MIGRSCHTDAGWGSSSSPTRRGGGSSPFWRSVPGDPRRSPPELGLSRPATTRQLHLLRDAGLVAAMPSLVDRRAVLYVIAPRQHGPITAWLAGTSVGRPIALAIDDDGRLHHG